MMEKEQSGKTLFRGELALVIAVLVNSFGVVLMLYSGAGISAISSVPYAFSLAFPALTLGTWTYLFQGTLIASLMIMRRKWVWPYLFSFVVGFVFSELLDVHELWIDVLPYTLPWRVVYFVVSYLLICFGIALSNRCGLPIVPTDLFPRELADITKVPYPRIKIGFDVTCLAITAGMTFFFLGRLEGLGIGTIAAVLCWPYVVVVFLLLFPGVQEMPIASTIVAFVITSPLPMWTTITDGGWSFLLGGVLLYALRGHRRVQLTAWAVLIFLCDFVPTFGMLCRQADFVWTQMFTDYYEWFGVAAVLLMLLYNGQRGKGHKQLFYWFYPAHVYLLYGASCLVYNVLR